MPSVMVEQKLKAQGYTFTGFWTRRCTHKDCGHKFRVEAPEDGFFAVVSQPCPKCSYVAKKTYLCKAERIWGRLNETHTCSSKCLNAKGPHCDCACGGKSHGAGNTIDFGPVSIPVQQGA